MTIAQRIGDALHRLRRLPRTPAGWRSTRLGHAASGRGDWASAVAHYRAALARNGHMGSVWLSLGYAQLGAGDAAGAARSFERATALSPDSIDAHRATAHAAKAGGDAYGAATRHLSIHRRWGLFEDLTAFAAALPIGAGRDELIERARANVPFFPPDPKRTGPTPATLLLDITELLLWYKRFRLPSGVQRVQTGLVVSLLSAADTHAAACCFADGEWRTIDTVVLLDLLALSETGDRLDAPEWRRALLSTHLSISGSEPLAFAPGAVLVSLGSWVTDAFLDAVDAARARSDLRYVPLIYDLIPVFRPEWFPPGVAENFPRWLERLSRSADGYMTISASTRRDLLRITADSGRSLDPDRVTVMTLDADCRSRFAASAPADTLERYGLPARGYVLSVGTIEPRKNHANALRAWRRLLDARPADAVPPLVLVGHGGWKNEEVHRLLAADDALRSKVRILSGVPDGDLSTLYAEARFILYPSLYEGWGLPVTEALCYGRTALVADNSSLPEAGGPFVDYVAADDVVRMAELAARLIDDDAYLAGRERQIAGGFRPRAWRELAADVEHAAALARVR